MHRQHHPAAATDPATPPGRRPPPAGPPRRSAPRPATPAGRPPHPGRWPPADPRSRTAATAPPHRHWRAAPPRRPAPTRTAPAGLDLPMPASPSTSTTLGWPPRAAAAAASSTASSPARPTNTPQPGGGPPPIACCIPGLTGSRPPIGPPDHAEPGSPPLVCRPRAMSASRACLAFASSRRQPSSLAGDTPSSGPAFAGGGEAYPHHLQQRAGGVQRQVLALLPVIKRGPAHPPAAVLRQSTQHPVHGEPGRGQQRSKGGTET